VLALSRFIGSSPPDAPGRGIVPAAQDAHPVVVLRIACPVRPFLQFIAAARDARNIPGVVPAGTCRGTDFGGAAKTAHRIGAA